MSKKVYAVRMLVETEEDEETVESRVRGWGEATFEGCVLLDLAQVRTSLADIDTLTHTLARMIKSQEHIQGTLERTTTVFERTTESLQDMVTVVSSWTKLDEPLRADLLDLSEEVEDKATAEEVEENGNGESAP